MSSAQRVCVITGGSRGIGLATALRFARGGASVVIAARDPTALQTAVEQIRRTGAACEAVPVDVAMRAGVEEVIDVARARFGRVDVLVNNVGFAPLAPVERTSDDDFEHCVGVNIAAVFYATRAVWPLMRAQGGGVIVNVSSMASVDPFAGFAVYGACKAWVNLFTKAVAEEGRPLGIRVFAVAPGAVETALLRRHFPYFPAEQTLDPGEVAAVIEDVCAERTAHRVGETIFVRKQ